MTSPDDEGQMNSPDSSDWNLELSCAIFPALSFRDWCLLLGVLPDPIEDFPFAIVMDGAVLSAVSWIVQPVLEGRLDKASWTIECSRQGMNGCRDIPGRFCEILHECDLRASALESLKIRVLP
jgi:hypothetical protein